jgi:heme exporter protein D
MSYTGYILAAYLASALVFAALILWVALDLRLQKRRLRELEERGLRRPGAAP